MKLNDDFVIRKTIKYVFVFLKKINSYAKFCNVFISITCYMIKLVKVFGIKIENVYTKPNVNVSECMK